MRRTLCSLGVAAALLIGLACSKKQPTAPPQPACSVSPTSLTFDPIPVGFSSPQKTFTITNTGGGTLAGTVSSPCPDFSIESGAGDYRLAAGQSVTVALRFVPQSAGSKSCQVSTDCSQVTLTGATTATPCQLVPTSLEFDSVTVGQTRDLTFSLTNNGSPIDTIRGTMTEPCNDFSLVGQTTYRLGGGQSQSFTVRFAPSVSARQLCSIQTGSTGCSTVGLAGTGVPVSADCEISPATLSFGQVAIAGRADLTFQVRNVGSGRLTGSVSESCPEFSIPGTTSYDLGAGASQTFIVRFEPVTEGAKNCTVNTGTGCAALPVTGTGQVGCEANPFRLAFGIVRYAGTGFREFSLSNFTDQPLIGRFFPPFPFTVRSLTGVVNAFSVAAHQSQTYGVSFDPPDVSGRCDSTHYEGPITTDTPLCDTVFVSGAGAWTCDCSVNPTALSFGNVVVGQTSASQNVTVRNGSPKNSSRGGIRVLSGDFVVQPTYGCASCGPTCTSIIPVFFRPQRLGSQTGKIVFAPPDGCLVGGSPCDTLTVTGTGMTAAPH